MAPFEQAWHTPAIERRVLEIRAGRESALARQDHGLGFKIVGETFRRFGQFEDKLAGESVPAVAAVHRHRRHRAVANNGDEFTYFDFAHAALGKWVRKPTPRTGGCKWAMMDVHSHREMCCITQSKSLSFQIETAIANR